MIPATGTAQPRTVGTVVRPSAQLLTVQDVMAALQVSRWTVYELIRGCRLRTVKIGRCRRIPASAFDDYVRSL